MLRVPNFRGFRTSGAPDAAAAPSLHRRRLLLLGWGLAGALPLMVLALLFTEYLHVQRQAVAHTRVLTDAVERQLRDRLFLVGRQLAYAARSGRPARGWAIQMEAVRVRPATPAERRDGRIGLGVPVSAQGRWWIPVSLGTGGRVVHARIPAALLEDVVTGYRLGRHDFISLIHDRRVLVARSVNHDRLVGRPLEASRIFAPAHRLEREGEYTGRSVVDGVWRHYTFRRLGDLPLTILVGVERQRLVGAWTGPALAVLGVSLLLAFAWGWLVRRYDRMQAGQRGLIRRLQAAEAQYRFLFEHNPLPMWVFDRDTLEIIAVNDAMLAHYGHAREDLVGRSMLSLRPEEDVEAMRNAARLDSDQAPQGRVWTHLHRDGRAMRMAIFRHDIAFDGRSARLVAAQDVTDREQTEQRFRMIARATSDAVYDCDLLSGRIWWSESYYTRFGQVPGVEHTLAQWADHLHPADLERVDASLQAALGGSAGEWQEQYRFRRGDGRYLTVLDRAFIQRDATGRALRLVGGMLDISERQHFEDQLAWRATHDALTGLPNRQLLVDRVEQAILNAQRYGREAALIFIDLDDFKLVNDSLGHSAGDRVLKEVATRLRSVARETDTVARFGGDEFVVVLTEHNGETGINDVIARIRAKLADPVTVAGTDHTVTASLGWCRYPDGGRDAESLLMHGDMAMYQAKRQGRNRAVAYQPVFAQSASQRLVLVSQLRHALERGEFVPVFQPLYDRDGRLTALETLVRWQHPERGLLFPGEFIEVCESSGLIVELGRQMLAHAARHWRLLAERGLGHVRIAVNVSPAQFTDELLRHVTEVIDGYGVPAEVLELEITEGLLMGDPERAIALMAQIVARGASFAIDDFGTGYSSLAYLKRFPIDRLKIDRSFVRDLGVDEDDAAICTSIIGLARSMGIRTVAEGVETELQLEWLRERRIDEVQGYLLGRPCAFEALALQEMPAACR